MLKFALALQHLDRLGLDVLPEGEELKVVPLVFPLIERHHEPAAFGKDNLDGVIVSLHERSFWVLSCPPLPVRP